MVPDPFFSVFRDLEELVEPGDLEDFEEFGVEAQTDFLGSAMGLFPPE